MATLLPDTARAHTFDGLADEVIAYALNHARTVTARRGEALIRQGEPARQIFVVRDGYTKLVSTSQGGHDVLVGIAGPRDAFGHATMADQQRDYLVTSTALTPLTAAVWDRDKALDIAREFPDVHKKIDAQLMRNLELVLARALLELAERHGQPDAIGILIAPPMTRQDIAAIVGTTLFTASRLLSEWENQACACEASKASACSPPTNNSLASSSLTMASSSSSRSRKARAHAHP